MKKMLIAAILSATVILFTTSVEAAFVTFNYNGTFNAQGFFDSPPINFSGATITGSYTFDSTTPDASSSSWNGAYLGTLTNLSGNVTYGGGSFLFGASNGRIDVQNNYPNNPPGSYRDTYKVTASSSADGVFDDLPNYILYSFDIHMTWLSASPGSDMTSDVLPLVPPDLFGTPPLITVRFPGANTALYFNLTSLTAAAPIPTPIPGALVLFGSGLLGLVGIGRKRFKK